MLALIFTGGTTSAAPVADFVGTPTSGLIPLSVSFLDLSTNSPTSWLWDFGDGNTSTVQNPTHSYAVVGVYTVALTATNAFGSTTNTKTQYIIALSVPTITDVIYFSFAQVDEVNFAAATADGIEFNSVQTSDEKFAIA
jgi:PKD repeat protein